MCTFEIVSHATLPDHTNRGSTGSTRWADARAQGSMDACQNTRPPSCHTHRWTSRIRCSRLKKKGASNFWDYPKTLGHHVSESAEWLSLKTCPVLLTATGDLLVSLIAAVVVEFSVGVVQDGPALRVLHGISVALVVNLATPAGPKEANDSNAYNTLKNFWSVGKWGKKNLTCPDHRRGSQSLLCHSSSRSRHSQIRANCPAWRTGSYSWTGWGPCSPRTGLQQDKQRQSGICFCTFKSGSKAASDRVGLTYRKAQSQKKHGMEVVHPQVGSVSGAACTVSHLPSSHVYI